MELMVGMLDRQYHQIDSLKFQTAIDQARASLDSLSVMGLEDDPSLPPSEAFVGFCKDHLDLHVSSANVKDAR